MHSQTRVTRCHVPSMGRSVGTFAPPSLANVTNRSIVVANDWFVTPAGILPGQRAIAGTSIAAFPGAHLAFEEQARRTTGEFLAQPGTVVGREEDERVVFDTEFLDGLQHLAARPVEFLDHITVQPAATLSCETARWQRAARAASCAPGRGRTGFFCQHSAA